MQEDGCKVYMDSFVHGIQWIMFHGHLNYSQKPPLESRLNTKEETMALQMLTTVDLFYFTMCEDPHE